MQTYTLLYFQQWSGHHIQVLKHYHSQWSSQLYHSEMDTRLSLNNKTTKGKNCSEYCTQGTDKVVVLKTFDYCYQIIVITETFVAHRVSSLKSETAVHYTVKLDTVITSQARNLSNYCDCYYWLICQLSDSLIIDLLVNVAETVGALCVDRCSKVISGRLDAKSDSQSTAYKYSVRISTLNVLIPR